MVSYGNVVCWTFNCISSGLLYICYWWNMVSIGLVHVDICLPAQITGAVSIQFPNNCYMKAMDNGKFVLGAPHQDVS